MLIELIRGDATSNGFQLVERTGNIIAHSWSDLLVCEKTYQDTEVKPL
jgi:hypothetical protein